jgi:hypothetical protein
MRRLLWLAAVVASVALAADTATFNWLNPSTYTDGAALDPASIAQTNVSCTAIVIAGVRTGCSLPVKSYPGAVQTGAEDFTFTDPRGGQICFAAQTQLMNGAVSAYSAEACRAVSPKSPSPPTLFTLR